MAESKFFKGLRTWKKRDGAPATLAGTITITQEDINQDFIDYAEFVTEYNGKKQLRGDVWYENGILTIKPNTFKK